MSAERPYTPVTLADRWGCSTAHIYNLLNARKLAGFRLGKLWRIPVTAVEDYEASLVGPTGERPAPSAVSTSPKPPNASTAARLARLT